MSLTLKARSFYANRRMAARYVLAVRYLRARRIWILDGATAKWRAAV